MRASAHGGVRPWCEQGSSVTHAVAPARSCPPAAPMAAASACGPPTGCVAPSNRVPSAASITQPTQGFGGVDARTDAASSRARAMGCVSAAVVMSSPGPAGPRAGTTTRSTRIDHVPSSLPSGLSPSAPGSHRIGRPTGREEVRGLHRRSGLPPNPARVLLSCAVSVQLERVLVPVTFVLVGALSGQQLEGVGDHVEHRVEGLDAPLGRSGRVQDQALPRACPPAARLSRPSGLTRRMASAMPGAWRSRTASVPSGVRSRGPNPVPPVVTTSPANPSQAARQGLRDRIGAIRP